MRYSQMGTFCSDVQEYRAVQQSLYSITASNEAGDIKSWTCLLCFPIWGPPLCKHLPKAVFLYQVVLCSGTKKGWMYRHA